MTEIDGGLLSTSLIKMKSSANGSVTAGLSGLNDNITLWGGGDYKKALAALAGTDSIPVLLTKAGVGSNIGCLKVVSATEVDVESTLGTIRIDTATGGIRIIAGSSINAIEKIRISPKKLADNEPDNKSGTVVTYPTAVTSEIGDTSANVMSQNYYTNSAYVTIKSGIVVEDSIDLNFDTYVYIDGSYTHSSSLDIGDCSVKFVLEAFNSTRRQKFVLAETTEQHISTMDPDYSEFISIATQHLVVKKTITMQGTYTIRIKAVFTGHSTIDSVLRANYVKLILCNKYAVHYAGGYIYDTPIVNNSYYTRHAFSVIASDGIATFYDTDTYFKVINETGQQKVIMKGLPTGTSGLESGQIYRTTDGNIRIKTLS